jgi:uncharacterized protein with ParB-like and HNH nuclease domain
VPIYQRHYVWNEKKQWEPFWADIRTKAIERLEGRERRFSHFMGALVLESRGAFSAKRVPSFQVVDGQQRLTTFQLFLAAARDYALSAKFEATASNIDSYIYNDKLHLMEEPDIEKFKVWPTQYDRPLFIDILTLGRAGLRSKYLDWFYKSQDKIYPYSHIPRLMLAYGYFFEKIKHAVETSDLESEFADASVEADSGHPNESKLDAIWQALVEEFKVVEIVLEDGDDAQVIFETLNERGEPLLAADLIRNNIFQRADARAKPGGPTAEKLFDLHWKPFEDRFWEIEEKQGRFKKPRLEFFLANFIAGQIASEVNLSKLFSEYKAFVRTRAYATIVDELIELSRYGTIYREIIERSSTSPLGEFARKLLPWDQTTVYPLVLRLWGAEGIETADKARSLEALLSYIVRRAACGLNNANYNKVFLSIIAKLDASDWTSGSVTLALTASKADSARFPDDAEFERGLTTKPLYSAIGPRVRLILEAIEKARRTRFSDASDAAPGLTVEHILPQSWAEHWRLPDGSQAQGMELWMPSAEDGSRAGIIIRRQRLKHTLGNLTLLTKPLNSTVSNGPFEQKRDEIAEHTMLELNRSILKASDWNEESIIQRGAEMAALAKGIWPYPGAMS